MKKAFIMSQYNFLETYFFYKFKLKVSNLVSTLHLHEISFKQLNLVNFFTLTVIRIVCK